MMQKRDIRALTKEELRTFFESKRKQYDRR